MLELLHRPCPNKSGGGGVVAPRAEADNRAMDENRPFWEYKRLDQLTAEEWEQLCDRCGRCCLHKFEDENGRLRFTRVACRLLDPATGACRDYPERRRHVPDCLQLAEDPDTYLRWLPASCAYRRLHEGRGLAWWHPLVSGRAETVREAGISVAGRVVSEEGVPETELEAHVIRWIR